MKSIIILVILALQWSLMKAKLDIEIPAGLPRRLHDVNNEKAAIRGIYNACCAKGCSVWRSSFQSPLSFDICDTPRVKCSKASERVEELDLRGFLLNCTVLELFNEVSKFSELKDLELSGNALLTGSLSDKIPAEADPPICTVIKNGLMILNMATTGLEGEIPSCIYSQDSSLKELYISNTRVTSLKDDFSTKAPLEILEAAKTPIISIPSTLGFLGLLKRLIMSENGMIGQVPQFSSTNLEELDLSKNSLVGGVPNSIAVHPSLLFMDINSNNLTSLPADWLTLHTNPSKYPIQYIDLSNNQLQEFPNGLADYPYLHSLLLSNNQLQGRVDSNPRAFNSLKTLDLRNNELSGPAPEWMKSVQQLQLQYSGLEPETFSDKNSTMVLDELTGSSDESASTDATAPSTSSDNGGLSGGAIAGIIIGVLLGCVIIGMAIFVLMRKKKYSKKGNQSDGYFERYSDNVNAVELAQPALK